MKKIGITGQNGFIGSHLFNRLSLSKDEFYLIPFENSFFDDGEALVNWVKQCDVIVHLAAINRHEDPLILFETNILLVAQLIKAVEEGGKCPHIIFSSSTQEEKDNLYGKSKKNGRELLEKWAIKNNAIVTGLIIPNVFGPFGKPFYNSVVSTFCYQLCNNLTPVVEIDGSLKLIYIDELVSEILKVIRSKTANSALSVQPRTEIYVSEILAKLVEFKVSYFEKGIFPNISDSFSRNLFNTFRSYITLTHFPVYLKKNTDQRGTFVETVKLKQGGQVSFSTTVKGITRGNHFHTRKIERFAVIKGKALIQLRKYNTKEIISFTLDGEEPSYVDMPVWYTHNIKNIGDDDLYTIFWVNEFLDPVDPDTFFEIV